MHNIYTATKVANLMGVTTSCVASLIKRNRIKAIREGRVWVITTDSLKNYISQRLMELDKESRELKDVEIYLK
jgi:excisionase family DNA binding protein